MFFTGLLQLIRAHSTTNYDPETNNSPANRKIRTLLHDKKRERVIISLGKNMLILFNGRKGVILTYALYPMARQQNQNIIGR